MARDHFNPAEFRHDSVHEIQQLQRRNSDFAVTNFGEFPRANNQITNICSPDGDNKPILPNCRLVNVDDLGAKISNQVAQSIAQTWEQIDLGSVQKLHDKRGAWGDRNEVPQYSAPRDSTSQYDAERTDEPQHATSPNRGGTQGRGRGEAGSATRDSTERSYSSENPPIRTGTRPTLPLRDPQQYRHKQSMQCLQHMIHQSPVTVRRFSIAALQVE